MPPGRWQSVSHLQAQAGMVPVTSRSGKHQAVGFRWACNMHLRVCRESPVKGDKMP